MGPTMKDERTGVSRQTSSNSLSDLLGDRSEPVTPEIAAEQAANRIIQAVRERERDRSKVDEST